MLLDKHKRLRARRKSTRKCLHCGDPLRKGFYAKVCAACQASVLKRRKKWEARRRRLGLCPRCGGLLEDVDKTTCRKCRDRSKKENLRFKLDAMKAYGGACSCCQETELMFLAIDHVHNDGAEHRREVFGSTRISTRRGSSSAMYRWLRKNDYPAGFQVLCHNCNIGKALNGGTCPHRTMRESSRGQTTVCKTVNAGSTPVSRSTLS